MKYSYIYKMPLGNILISEENHAITEISFDENHGSYFWETPLIQKAAQQIFEYFSGTRSAFDFTLNPTGTPFQKKVWQALLQIPYGETRSYKDIAMVIGNRNSCRAVGMANHKNPIAIVIPCHRVIGITGKPVGYAGGLDKKIFLLNHENTHHSMVIRK